MSLMQRRRALMGALDSVPKILPGTVIWENLVTGLDNLTILSYGGAHCNHGNTGYDITLAAARPDGVGACVLGFGTPMDFSRCSKIVFNYALAKYGGSYSSAPVRFGLGQMPSTAQEFYSNSALYIPETTAFQRTVPSTNIQEEIEIKIAANMGAVLPIISIWTAGSYSGGLYRPIKIWVE